MNHRGTLQKKSSSVPHTPLDKDVQHAKAVAEKLKIPFVDPLQTHVEPAALGLLTPEMAFRRQALPIRLVDDILLVAMLKPEQPIAIKSLELLTGYRIRPAIAPRHSLCYALERYYGNGNNTKRAFKHANNETVKTDPVNQNQEEIGGSLNISIISNKGGVGKTHLSINLACALAKIGAKVLLIDADLGNADISNKIGIFPKCHLMDFLEKKKQMREIVCHTKFGFDLIAGSFGEFKLANLYHAQKIRFLNHFKKISQKYKFVIFDLGAGISRTVLDFALAADHTVILTTPQDIISGYACTKAGFSRFKEIEEKLEEKLPDYKPQWAFSPLIVINQVNDLRQGFELFETIRKTADENINSVEGRFRIKPEYLGAVPYDKEGLRAAEKKRKPLLLTSPRIKASQSIQHMSTRFVNPKDAFESKVTFNKHPLKRFAAILSQKI